MLHVAICCALVGSSVVAGDDLLRPPALPLDLPDLPGYVLQRDLADQRILQLKAGDAELWSLALPADHLFLTAALAPDLDGDLVREIRIALLPREGGDLQTRIISGATGKLLFTIQGRAPFDPWFSDPRDTNNDGEVTFEDDSGITLPLKARPPFLRSFTPWNVLRHGRLPANVTSIGRGEILAEARGSRFSDRAKRGSSRSGSGSGGHRVSGDGGAGPGSPPQLHVKRVDFSNALTISRDYGGIYSKIWFDNNDDGDADDWAAGDVRAPICYVAPDPLTVSSVVFRVDPPFAIDITSATAYGRILGTQDVFTSTSLSYNGAGTQITATMSGSASFWTTIAYVANYSIAWRIQSGTT